MITVSIAGYIMDIAETISEHYSGHDALVDAFDLERPDSPGKSALYLEISRAYSWPFLCVAQQYTPNHWAGQVLRGVPVMAGAVNREESPVL